MAEFAFVEIFSRGIIPDLYLKPALVAGFFISSLD